jgi:predicted amidohydrolase
MSRIIRLAAVSYAPPPHDHHRLGVDLRGIAAMVKKAAREKPDFICFPEICACSGPLEKALSHAPELEPFVSAVGKIAKDFNVNLVVPFLERLSGQVYNSVPIVERTGKLAMVYRKNYPTPGEMKAGIVPGWEVPVAECDGVRVGAAVCFDANFPQVAAELERQRARLVFWPSMFWGGRLLEHWALRYALTIVVAYGAESAVIDMSGRYLVKQGLETHQVRGARLPPWAVADVNLDREVYHLDYNQEKFPAIRERYGPDVQIEVYQPEAFFLLASRRAGLTVEQVAKEFGLETLREYMSRSVKMREEHLRAHPKK